MDRSAARATDDGYLQIGQVTIMLGADNGRYPDGNTVVLRGSDEVIVIDPSLTVVERGGVGVKPDRVINSHCHEDHICGNHLFPGVPIHMHDADKSGLDSIDAFMDIYGMPPGPDADEWREQVLEEFFYQPAPDALSMADGEIFEVGGSTATVIHLPGHTRGHCGVLIEPEGIVFLADVELTGFGPYYGDAWSDLEEFEQTLETCEALDGKWFATFHHKGVIEGRDQYLAMLREFAEIIDRREQALIEFLAEPRTMDEIAEHRFIYRPSVESPFVDSVERRSMARHLARLVPQGRVAEIEPGRFRAVT